MAHELDHPDALHFLSELSTAERAGELTVAAAGYLSDPALSDIAPARACRRALVAAELLAASRGAAGAGLPEASAAVLPRLGEATAEGLAGAAKTVASLARRSPLAREAAGRGEEQAFRERLSSLHERLVGQRLEGGAEPGSGHDERAIARLMAALRQERAGQPAVDLLSHQPDFDQATTLDELLLARLAEPLGEADAVAPEKGALPAERGAAALTPRLLGVDAYLTTLSRLDQREKGFDLGNLVAGLWRFLLATVRAGRPDRKPSRGKTVVRFSADDFAWQVFTLVHALGGDAARGLLGAASGPEWDLGGGIAPSLALLDACGAWAAAQIEGDVAGRSRTPFAAVPVLSLARFRLRLRRTWKVTPSFDEASRRVPCWGNLSPLVLDPLHARADALADAIAAIEAEPFSPPAPGASYELGQLVRTKHFGVTVLLSVQDDTLVVFSPTRTWDPWAKMIKPAVAPIEVPEGAAPLLRR